MSRATNGEQEAHVIYLPSDDSLGDYMRASDYGFEDGNAELCFAISPKIDVASGKYNFRLYFSSFLPDTIPSTTYDAINEYQYSPELDEFEMYYTSGFDVIQLIMAALSA